MGAGDPADFQIPQVTKVGLCDTQVCVPWDWTDEQAEEFANAQRPTGLDHGWKLRTADDKAQNGAPIRVACKYGGIERRGFCHIMLSC